MVVVFLVLNLLYRYRVIDPTNKAYGLNYTGDKEYERPLYDRQTLLQMCSDSNVERDRANMIRILERMESPPINSATGSFYLINISGGGEPERLLYDECSSASGQLMSWRTTDAQDLSDDRGIRRRDAAGGRIFPGTGATKGCGGQQYPSSGSQICQ